MKHYNLNRFLEAQQNSYPKALEEIQQWQKQSHWMWFIFPQIKGLGFTDFNVFYGIENLEEAQAYYDHPVLGNRLTEISQVLLDIENKTALEIMGKPDERKLRSCMTLFSLLPNANPVFQNVLEKYYQGIKDEKTIALLSKQ